MNIRSILPALSMAVVFSGHAADFSLTSQDIADSRPLTQREVFQGFGCEGGNTSPAAFLDKRPLDIAQLQYPL